MSGPLHSVIVAAHDAEDTLGLTLTSVSRQTDPDYEVLVVDDGSEDRTRALALGHGASDPRIRVMHQTQAGPGAARNAGIAAAAGELLTFLDSDDLLMPTYLARMREAFDEAPGAALAYADAWTLNRRRMQVMVERRERWHFERPAAPPATAAEALLSLAHGNYIGGVRSARRDAVVEAGGFATGFRHGEDYDLWVRLALAGHEFVALEKLAVISDRDGSLSKDELALIAGTKEVCERLLGHPACSPQARAAAERQLELLDRWEAAVTFRSPVRGAALRARRAIRRARERFTPGRLWHPELPDPVAAAFPELDQLASSGESSGAPSRMLS